MTILNEDSIPIAHRCERTLTRFDTRDYGTIVQCSCGLVYELRKTTTFRWLFGPGAGNKVTQFRAIQYWHVLEWSDPR